MTRCGFFGQIVPIFAPSIYSEALDLQPTPAICSEALDLCRGLLISLAWWLETCRSRSTAKPLIHSEALDL